MKWTERNIASALATQFFDKKYLVVVPNCSFTGYECDLLCITENLRIIDIEIKISRADLKADAKKDKWWQRDFTGYTEEFDVVRNGGVVGRRRDPVYDTTKLQWPRKVWKHYYAMPQAIWRDELLDSLPSENSGILLLTENNGRIGFYCKRMAKPQRDAEKIGHEAVINIARLASLRMWGAYKAQEATQRDYDKHLEMHYASKQQQATA